MTDRMPARNNNYRGGGSGGPRGPYHCSPSQPNSFLELKREKNQKETIYFILFKAGRGVSEKVSANGFCLGSGLFGSCNSNQRLLAKSWNHILNKPFIHIFGTYWFIKYKGFLRNTNILPMYQQIYRTFLQALIKFK